MKVTEDAINLIKEFEAFRAKAYQDSGGVWTIGYGTTASAGVGITPKAGMVISEPQADQYLRLAVDKFAKQINTLIKKPLTDNQYSAVISLAYNIGPTQFAGSTVLKKINTGDYNGARKAFAMWNKDNGKVIQGLINRRNKEIEIFSKTQITGDQMFSGKKTYIVAGVAIISTVASYLVGDISVADAAQAILTAVLGATIRHGIANK